jgi:phage repressor protein C with HTH and peptisase S24 domain
MLSSATNTFQCAVSTPKRWAAVLDSPPTVGYRAFMGRDDHFGRRIAAAREAKGMSQVELAIRVGTTQQTIGKIEKGIIRHTRFMRGIAEALNLDQNSALPDALFPIKVADAPIPAQRLYADAVDLPVLGASEAGSGMLAVSNEPIDYIRRPAILANVREAYGLMIAGDSMEPAFEPGDTVLINPHLPPVANTNVVLYADNGHGEVKTLIKRLVRFTATEWHLLMHNPPPGKRKEMVLPRSEWQKCHRIVGKYCR